MNGNLKKLSREEPGEGFNGLLTRKRLLSFSSQTEKLIISFRPNLEVITKEQLYGVHEKCNLFQTTCRPDIVNYRGQVWVEQF